MSLTTKTLTPEDSPDQGRSSVPVMKTPVLPASRSDGAEVNDVIRFPATESGSQKASGPAGVRPETAEVLPLERGPVNLPVGESSEDAIAALLRGAGSAARQAACLWFRTGKYGTVEEIHGREVGLGLMRYIESRLHQCLRKHDILCRVSDNEFVVMLYDTGTAEQVRHIAERLLAHCGGIYRTAGLRLHVTASIGIAMYPIDATEPHELLRYARMALREVNPQHPTQYAMFSPELLTRLRKCTSMVTELQRALEQDRLTLYYQPQYAIDTQRIVGVEALVRLVTESGELLAPDHFIELAEQTGQILELGRWVMEQACQQLGYWRRSGSRRIRMAVNVSPAQLMAADFCQVVDGAVARAGIQHSDLELEITERQVVEHLPQVERTLRALTAKGVRMAIDDFGTGYSSLACLTRLSIQAVKIDRTFMTQVPGDKRARRIVRHVIDMARELELDLTAEGIETDEQHHFLLQCGCDLGQGYNFARPQSPESIEKFLF